MQRIIKSYLSLAIMAMISSCSINDDFRTNPPGDSLRFTMADAESYYNSVLSESAMPFPVFFSTSDFTPLWDASKSVYSDDNTDIISVPTVSRVTYYAEPKNDEEADVNQFSCTRFIVIRYDTASGFTSVAIQYTFNDHSFFTDMSGNIRRTVFPDETKSRSLSLKEVTGNYDFTKSIKHINHTKSAHDSSDGSGGEFFIGGMEVLNQDYDGGWLDAAVITANGYYTVYNVPYVPTLADYYGNPVGQNYDDEDYTLYGEFGNVSGSYYSPLQNIADFANNAVKKFNTSATITHVKLLTYNREKCFLGYRAGDPDCMDVAKYLLKKFGVYPSGHSTSTDIATRDSEGEKVTVSEVKFDARLSSMIQNLEDGKPVVLGVTHSGFNESTTNGNDATQHFIVVTGYGALDDGCYFFRFVETGIGQDKWERATGDGYYNILYCDPDTQDFSGEAQMNKVYIYNVTEIRETYNL